MTAVSICRDRLMGEEGVERYPYDDATGLRVRAPVGHLTWGVGFDLDEIGTMGLFALLLDHLLGEIATRLMTTSWYPTLPDGVASVCLDIAYNAGYEGLLGYPHMIHFLALHDWANAAKECTSSNPKLVDRYAKLALIIARGE